MFRKLPSIVIALLTLVPTGAFAESAPDFHTLQEIRLPVGTETPLDCAAPLRLVVPGSPEVLTSPGGRFAALSISGAEGPLMVGQDVIATVDPGIVTHVLLRASPLDESVTIQCVAGAVATLRFFDAPVIETLDLPARVLSPTYTRPAMRAIGMDNLLEVYILTPVAGAIDVQVSAEGAPLPSTLETYGENANATANQWQASMDALLSDEDIGNEVAGALTRLALACGPLPPADTFGLFFWILGLQERRPEACAGAELDNLLSRYAIPLEAAHDLARRLHEDDRCAPQANQPQPPVNPLLWAPSSDLPCLELVSEWLDDSLTAEGLPPASQAASNALRALGLRENLTQDQVIQLLVPLNGPCGDPLQNLAGDPLSNVANRTLPSRQRDCLELLVGSLRPVRYMWRSDELIARMGSFDFGLSSLRLATRGPTEGKLTVASQGPVLLDLTIGLAGMPETAGDAMGPFQEAADDLADAFGTGPIPWPEELQDAGSVPLNGQAVADASDALTAAFNDTAGAALEQLLAQLVPNSCTLNASSAEAGCGSAPEAAPMPPLLSYLPDVQTVWAGSPVTQLPASVPLSYTSDPMSAATAFLAAGRPPTTSVPTAGTGLGGAVLQFSGAYSGTLFVPHSIEARFGPLEDPSVPLPAGNAEETRRKVVAFVQQRLADTYHVLADSGVHAGDPNETVPIEIILTGTTFRYETDDGTTTLTRKAPTFRLLNLREGFLRQDFDLDGAATARELEVIPAAIGLTTSSNLLTVASALDPFDPDSDADAMPDGYELLQCDNPISLAPGCDNGVLPWKADGQGDADADLLTDSSEYGLTAAAFSDEPCLERLRWACIVDAASQARAGSCAEPHALLAWSPTVNGQMRSRDGDCDGFTDGWETRFAFDPLAASAPDALADDDEDGLTNAQEHAFYAQVVSILDAPDGVSLAQAVAVASAPGPSGALLRPDATDTDDDGLPDGYEASRGLWDDGDPAFRHANPADVPRRLAPLAADADQDPDGDGISTLEEFEWSLRRVAAEHPIDAPRRWLVALEQTGLNPFQADTDSDGLNDASERAGFDAHQACMDPLAASVDCDADGIQDIVERYLAGDPSQTPEANAQAVLLNLCNTNPAAWAARSSFDWQNSNSDNDTLPDWFECWFALDPTHAADALTDADADGLNSTFEYELTLDLSDDHRQDPAFFAPRDTGLPPVILPTDVPLKRGPQDDFSKDHDHDELPDAYELALGMDLFVQSQLGDPDKDGLNNWAEFTHVHPDGNSTRSRLAFLLTQGFLDDEFLENLAVALPSPFAADSDADGMADGWEVAYDLDPVSSLDASLDADGDNATNVAEFLFSAQRHPLELLEDGTAWLLSPLGETLDPTDRDTDGDHISDGFEIAHHARQGCAPTDTYDTGSSTGTGWAHCFDPLDPDDADDDFDGDGLTNLEEFLGWDVTIVTLKIRDEIAGDRRENATYHTSSDPLKTQTSGDGISDAEKAPHRLPGCLAPVALDPYLRDTDDDGITDFVEIWQWTAVQGLPEDIDGDCVPNAADRDSDADSFSWGNLSVVDLSDGAELDLKLSEPTRHDTDRDGFGDGREFYYWRASGKNPANVSSDFDGDGAWPLRDWDEDADLIPGGYEFRVGLLPWEFRDAAHDTDNDTLSDLCEYRLSAHGAIPMCPAVEPPGSDGPAQDGGFSPGAPAAAGVINDDAPENCIDENVNAFDHDCDSDGINDGFEFTRQLSTAGCNPNSWTYHGLADGLGDACFQAYVAQIVKNGSTIASYAFLNEPTKPHVKTMLFGYAFGFQPENAPCLYHRQCRATLGLKMPSGPADDLAVNLGVEDVDCNLEKVSVVPSGEQTYVRDSQNWQNFQYPVGLATGPQEQECQSRLAQGLPYLYVFRLPVTPLTATPGHRVHIEVHAWDRLNNAHATYADVNLASRGFDALAEANNAIDKALGQDQENLAKSVMAATNAHYQLLTGRDPDRPIRNGSDIAYARGLVADGTSKYNSNVKWFDEPTPEEPNGEYGRAMNGCGQNPDRPSNPAAAAKCGAVRVHVEAALGAKVRHMAGVRTMRDLAMPIMEGLSFSTRHLLEAGRSQRDIAGFLATAYRPSFGKDAVPFEPNLDELRFWDWFMAGMSAPNTQEQGCVQTHNLMNGRRQAIQGATEPPGLPSLQAAKRFAAVSRGIPGLPPPIWNLDCIGEALNAHSQWVKESTSFEHKVVGIAGEVDLAYSGSSLYVDVIEHGMAATAMRSVRLDLASLALAVAWEIVTMSVSQEIQAHPMFKLACVLIVAAGAALSVATAGAAIGVAIIVLGIFSAHDCLVGINKEKRPDCDAQASGLAHSWRYCVETYPDTDRSTSDEPKSRELIRLRIHDIVKTNPTCPDKFVTNRGIEFFVYIDRLEGNEWKHESRVHYSRDGVAAALVVDQNGRPVVDEHGRYVFVLFNGLTVWDPKELVASTGSWSLGSDQETMQYKGLAVPGLRRITIEGRPALEIDARTKIDYPALETGENWNSGLYVRNNRHGQTMERPPPFRIATTPGPAPGVETCKKPAMSEVVLFRGIGADIRTHTVRTSKGTLQDVNPTQVGQHREMMAVGALEGPGYTYYWDFGDGSPTAAVTTDPGAVMDYTFSREDTFPVVLTVTNERHEVVQQIAGQIQATSESSDISFQPERSGDKFRFHADVVDPDDCLTWEFKVNGVRKDGSESPCTSSSPPSDLHFDREFPVPSDGIQAGDQATFTVYKNGQPVRAPDTFRICGKAANTLQSAPVEGSFCGGSYEYDEFTYTVPQGVKTLQFTVQGDPRMRFEVSGPDRWDHRGVGTVTVRSFIRIFWFIWLPRPLPGTTWTVRVFSNGVDCDYTLSTNLQSLPPAPSCDSVCTGSLQDCSTMAPNRPLNFAKDSYGENFENDPFLGSRQWSNAGKGEWHRSTYDKAEGQSSAHVGYRGSSWPTYDDGPERDYLELTIPIDAWGVPRTQPMSLRFQESAKIHKDDPGHYRAAWVKCSGRDTAGTPVARGANEHWSALSKDTGGWTAQEIDFDCTASRVESGLTITVLFEYHSDRNPRQKCSYLPIVNIGGCGPKETIGWFVDDLELVQV